MCGTRVPEHQHAQSLARLALHARLGLGLVLVQPRGLMHEQLLRDAVGREPLRLESRGEQDPGSRFADRADDLLKALLGEGSEGRCLRRGRGRRPARVPHSSPVTP